MEQLLKNKNIAVLMTDGFEEVEYTIPREALDRQGANVEVVSEKAGLVRAWDHHDWGNDYRVDKSLDQVEVEAYDGLLLPGGVMNPDQLRKNEQAVAFARAFFDAGKPIAAICHGTQLLIETEALQHRELTSYPSIKTDLKNAGARWVDKEVVVDAGLVTSRSPEDLPAFTKKMIEEFCEGVHERQKTA
jgi:protease I